MCDQYLQIFRLKDKENHQVITPLHPNQKVDLQLDSHQNYQVKSQQNSSTPGIKTVYLNLKACTYYKLVVEGSSSRHRSAYLWAQTEDKERLIKKYVFLPKKDSTKVETEFKTGSATQVKIGILITHPEIGDSFCLKDLNLYEINLAGSLSGHFSIHKNLFSHLPSAPISSEILSELSNSMIIPKLKSQDLNLDVPLGYVFLGQFIAHELTLNISSGFKESGKNLVNIRTPIFDLDQVYSNYQNNKFMYGSEANLLYQKKTHDLPRTTQNAAIIGDPRNDENFMLAQLHLVFIKFHNQIIKYLKKHKLITTQNVDEIFRIARQYTTWHFQWLVIHDYLKTFVKTQTVENILDHGAKFYTSKEAQKNFIPTEFTVAIFRFGHATLVDQIYLNQQHRVTLGELFQLTQGHLPKTKLDWNKFFALSSKSQPQPSKKITPQLISTLHKLPDSIPKPAGIKNNSLSNRNLHRGLQFQLPSGQTIAKEMNHKCAFPILNSNQIKGQNSVFKKYPQLCQETPLFYYILREAEVFKQSKKLGPLGGRLIAEVMIENIRNNPNSFLYQNPGWKPFLPSQKKHEFTIADLINFALSKE